MDKLIEVRRELHRFPEISGNEKNTALRIRDFIKTLNPDEIIEKLGGDGVAFIFDSKKPGPTVMFRAELDALPIDEINDFPHRSVKYNVSHKCGHDGHMTILSGLANSIAEDRPAKGRAILLFQPAEETGEGALQVLEDQKFKQIEPTYIFALHNLPGYSKNAIVLKEGVFSSASTGLSVKIVGKTSHAAEPEKGANPAFAMASILKVFEKYFIPGNEQKGIKIITPIHVKLGERAFGTNPGYAELMFTLRATYSDDFDDLKRYVIKTIDEITADTGLIVEYEWVEEFPNTVNDKKANYLVFGAAKEAGLESVQLGVPFRWSEDFGHFLDKYPGALFGLGAGEDQPALHNPDYDFPEEIIRAGVTVFFNIYKNLLF